MSHQLCRVLARPPSSLPRRAGCQFAKRCVAALLICAGLAACAPTLPVIVKPLDCPVPADLLAQRCDAPKPVPDGINYADVISLGIDDRQALRACAAHDRLLANLISECQQAIRAYNATLQELNDKIANKR